MTWSEKGEGRSASAHYDVMELEDIIKLPVRQLADKDCVLLIWVPDSMLPWALRVIEAWGFEFKTVGFYWVKQNSKGLGFFTGPGKWTRTNPEMCLLATIGHPKRKSRSVRRLVVSRLREHSRKPDEVRDRIEKLVAGPYCELFARSTKPGWDTWGNQSGMFDNRSSLRTRRRPSTETKQLSRFFDDQEV